MFFKSISRRDFMKGMMVGGVAAASAGVLTACGSGSSESSDSESSSSEAAGSESGSSEASSGSEETETTVERQTITWSVIDQNAGNNNVGDYAEEIMQMIEDYVGHDLELTWVANDTLTEKNSLYLASPKTMPQIMSWGGTVTGDVVSAANNGAFVDLNNYVWDEAKYPNLSQMAQSVADNLTVNGQLIALPRSRVVGRYGLCYRQDWAELLGVELANDGSATPEDVYEMLYAFTYDDPDGDGSNDTIGMEMTSYTGPFDIIQTWFGCGNGWAEVDGQLVPVWMQDEYFEAVEYIKRIYENGLMPADFVDRPTDSWSDGCKKGDNGVFIDVLDSGKRIWQYFAAEDTWTASVVNPDENATMVFYGAVNGHTLATAGYNGYFTLSATTCDTEEKIEAALTVLDKLNDAEMLILTQYGLEGVNYEYDSDGYLVDTDTEDSSLKGNYLGLNQLLAYLPSTEECTERVHAQTDEINQAQNDAYEAALPYAVVNPALSYRVNSSAYSENGATLDDEASALRTQYICGAISLDDFKSGLDNIRTKGYDTIIEEVNEQYQANQ
ncbi:MAG: substrate-binding domain-containing protein [Lachnospiraceae bacterium]|nr:substrate-binding domain-containing protein [Lachnospiraceae bacterium]